MKIAQSFLITIANILFPASLFILAGCASGRQLAKYPRRQIDRPYTLPSGIASWSTIAGFKYYKNNYGLKNGEVIGNMTWTESLSDDWNLIWLPLPLAVTHQISKTKDQQLGTTFVMGMGYSSLRGFQIAPSLSVTERLYLANAVALDITPKVAREILFQDGQSPSWHAGIRLGVLLQLSDTVALSPGLSLEVERNWLETGSYDANNVPPPSAPQFIVPLGLNLDWSITRQWDLNASYNYDRIGYAQGYVHHEVYFAATYFW